VKRSLILGVFVDPLTQERLRERLNLFFVDGESHMIVTPNPEMILVAASDPIFKACLNTADLAIPDGVGLIFASRVLRTEPITTRVTGVDTLELLATICAQQGEKLFLLGGVSGVAQKASLALSRSIGKETINFVAYDDGGIIEQKNGKWQMNPAVLEHIKQEAPAVLAVALGHGKQEKWIRDFLPHLPSVKIAIGVGGALDYLSGTVPRAPRLMRRLGLEWLFRLLCEPRRIVRIWRAVIVFPLAVIWDRIMGPHSAR